MEIDDRAELLQGGAPPAVGFRRAAAGYEEKLVVAEAVAVGRQQSELAAVHRRSLEFPRRTEASHILICRAPDHYPQFRRRQFARRRRVRSGLQRLRRR